MASSWVKSLQCKSKAFEDVYHPKPKALIQSASCRKSVQSIKDVIDTKTPSKRHTQSHTLTTKSRSSSSSRSRSFTQKTDPKPDEPPPQQPFACRTRVRSARSHDPGIPTLTELPSGHPSRNVVDIIFHTSWSPKAFTGRVEMIFKVQNGPRAVGRFEEYRDAVRSRVGGEDPKEDARCAADGNEVMGFHCLGPASCDGYGGAWAFPGGKGAAICTYSGSGGAHESAGGGRGVRAMLVCRVVAGRVGFDSVSGEGDGLLVFDSRAVLPCFLIIYNL